MHAQIGHIKNKSNNEKKLKHLQKLPYIAVSEVTTKRN